MEACAVPGMMDEEVGVIIAGEGGGALCWVQVRPNHSDWSVYVRYLA